MDVLYIEEDLLFSNQENIIDKFDQTDQRNIVSERPSWMEITYMYPNSLEPIPMDLRQNCRGSQGIWSPIRPMEMIRTDQLKGKLLRAVIILPCEPDVAHLLVDHAFEICVQIYNISDPCNILTHIVQQANEVSTDIIDQTGLRHVVRIEVKFKTYLCAKFQYIDIKILSKEQKQLAHAVSVTYTAHNNGRIYIPKGRVLKPKKKRSRSKPYL